ncbi:MAG: ribonuclease III [Lachnospiraceae bacterium]|nr:ribonuclease III [Lachnospiraceae bacterium]
MNAFPFSDLEENIGYHFHDPSLLETAMTHTSYANEHRRENIVSNERLEFLGDAVLEAVSSEYLYRKYPDLEEGKLSKMRASMVCEPSLAIIARRLELPRFLILGKGEEFMNGRKKDSITSDAVESVIGAIYLDAGFEEAKRFILKHVLGDLKKEELYYDNKTRLQEYVQERGMVLEYKLISAEGPDHNKLFRIAVIIDDEICGVGEGRTKKAASQDAAKAVLERLCI